MPVSLWTITLVFAAFEADTVTEEVPTDTLVTVAIEEAAPTETVPLMGTGVARSSASVNGPVAVTVPEIGTAVALSCVSVSGPDTGSGVALISVSVTGPNTGSGFGVTTASWCVMGIIFLFKLIYKSVFESLSRLKLFL